MPVMRLDSSPRIRRTVIVPGGTCGSGRGMPDIFDGSIIIGCASAAVDDKSSRATSARFTTPP